MKMEMRQILEGTTHSGVYDELSTRLDYETEADAKFIKAARHNLTIMPYVMVKHRYTPHKTFFLNRNYWLLWEGLFAKGYRDVEIDIKATLKRMFAKFHCQRQDYKTGVAKTYCFSSTWHFRKARPDEKLSECFTTRGREGQLTQIPEKSWDDKLSLYTVYHMELKDLHMKEILTLFAINDLLGVSMNNLDELWKIYVEVKEENKKIRLKLKEGECPPIAGKLKKT